MCIPLKAIHVPLLYFQALTAALKGTLVASGSFNTIVKKKKEKSKQSKSDLGRASPLARCWLQCVRSTEPVVPSIPSSCIEHSCPAQHLLRQSATPPSHPPAATASSHALTSTSFPSQTSLSFKKCLWECLHLAEPTALLGRLRSTAAFAALAAFARSD